MAKGIRTGRVSGRRQLHFSCLEDIRADVERLARIQVIRNLGNWSAGQVLLHLALVMEKSIDGYEYQMPAVVRWLVRLLFKRRFLTKPMSAGFQLPSRAAAELGPPAIGFEEGLERIRRALERLLNETKRSPHPVLGRLTVEEWTQLHCRHAALHLSFLVPPE